jgi:hypothetical protein
MDLILVSRQLHSPAANWYTKGRGLSDDMLERDCDPTVVFCSEEYGAGLFSKARRASELRRISYQPAENEELKHRDG